MFVLYQDWKEILNEVIQQGDSDDSIEVEEVANIVTTDTAATSPALQPNILQ